MKRKTKKSLNPLKLSIPDELFRNLPSLPGVYRMYDSSGDLIYVGKAKSLKARLSSYRNCAPETLPSKVARMIKRVIRIEFEVLATEEAALLKENKLLRSEKPIFNRRNTRQEIYAFISLKETLEGAELSLFSEIPIPPPKGLEFFGAFKGANRVRRALQLIERLQQMRMNADNLDSLILRERASLPSHIILKMEKKDTDLLRDLLAGSSNSWPKMKKVAGQKRDAFFSKLWKEAQKELLEFYRSNPLMNAKLKESFSLDSILIEKQVLDDLRVRAAFRK